MSQSWIEDSETPRKCDGEYTISLVGYTKNSKTLFYSTVPYEMFFLLKNLVVIDSRPGWLE